MAQDILDTLFSITIAIHEHEWFGKRNNPKDRDEVQKWVAKQLASTHQIYTIPCGASWGVITTKQKFNEYWGYIEDSNYKSALENNYKG